MTFSSLPGRSPAHINVVTKSRSLQKLGADKQKQQKPFCEKELFLEYPELLFHVQRKIV